MKSHGKQTNMVVFTMCVFAFVLFYFPVYGQALCVNTKVDYKMHIYVCLFRPYLLKLAFNLEKCFFFFLSFHFNVRVFLVYLFGIFFCRLYFAIV